VRLTREWIASHIPHRGRMCLLDEIIEWDERSIRCRSGGHRAADHPLRAHGRLGVACGVEIAAQAMAAHSALIAPTREGKAPAAGLLASVRGVRMHLSRLDQLPGDILCDALQIAGDAGTALYEFVLHAAGERVMSGRASVVLDGRPRT